MDYLTDIIIRIKNANWAGKKSVVFPYSLLGLSVAETLNKLGFLGVITKKGKRLKLIEAELVYDNDKPKIAGVRRISMRSKRVYVDVSSIKPVKNGYGKSMISTSSGIMTGDEARKKGVGGELLFEIW